MNYQPLFNFVIKHELMEQEVRDAQEQRISDLTLCLEDTCASLLFYKTKYKQLQNKHMRYKALRNQ